MKPVAHLSSLVTAAALAAALALPAAAVAADGGLSRVIVAYQAGARAPVLAELVRERGRVMLDLPRQRALAVRLPAAAVERLQRHPQVEYVEIDARRYPMGVVGGEVVPYGISMVQADQLALGATPRAVCVIDSGYALGHEDLPSLGVTGDSDPGGAGDWFVDESGHGTHVAGTIGAIGGNGIGVVGVAPGVGLHIVKVFNADGWAYSSTLVAAAERCQAAGAHVINMSLGGGRQTFTERRAFAGLERAGVLSIAAAGNGGNTRISYPAGYPGVMAVAAVDEAMNRADFSQYNRTVEIAGPGVMVLSTVPPGTALVATTSVGGVGHESLAMEGSPATSASAALHDFGLGDADDAGVAGKVCLIARGAISFADKVQRCEANGGVAAIIYNNAPGLFAGTLGGAATGIPSVSVSDTSGAAMLGQLGAAASVGIDAGDYDFFNGTSMATPHVAGVAALVWSHHPGCSAAQIRASLNKSAMDLGAPGRDNEYGHGLVQAKAAADRISALGCGN